MIFSPSNAGIERRQKKKGAKKGIIGYADLMNERITIDPNICHGKPCIKGTRIMVSNILNLLAHGASEEEILKGYPELTHEDISAALSYAESVIKDEEILLSPA